MRTILTSLVAAGVLVAGGFVAASIAGPGTASAQESTFVEPAVETVADVIQGLVVDGTLTQEQGDAVIGALEQHRAERKELREERRQERQQEREEHMQEVAGILGTTVEDLTSQLREGATLAEVAGDQLDELRAYLIDEANERIDTALADGKIDEDRAAELRADVEERVDAHLNGEHPRGPGHGGPRGHRGGGPSGGPGGFGNGPAEAPATGTSA